MMEIFIKDIIHDLNTPLTSILINLKMMDSSNEEVESIGRSAKTIAMLHQNLDAYLKERINESERFRLDEVINEQVSFFQPMYNYLTWEVDAAPLHIKSDKHAFTRIVYNLLSNACKYNTSDGFIKIFTEEEKLIISNSSYGIKDPSRVFERFYKESERGLGIGLHIVEKLTNQLKIRKEIQAEESTITFILDLSQVTSK
jgi:signal transduction histidine kinase